MQAGVLDEVLGVFLEALEMAWKVRFGMDKLICICI